MLLATPHFTVLAPMVVPTPMMDVQMICVVLTGMPATEAPIIVAAPAVSAANPCTGRSLVILYPMVLTIRHPPERVPSAMAAWAIRITQMGTGQVVGVSNGTEISDGEQQRNNDPHGLLCIICTVAETVGGCRKELETFEMSLCGLFVCIFGDIEDYCHEEEPACQVRSWEK